MTILVIIIIFFFMILIPFLIALKELWKPKDNKPLYIDMHYSKDPLYFGRAFKNLVHEKIESNKSPVGISRINLSKPESVEIYDSKSIPDNTRIENIFYIKEDFTTGNRTMLRKDVYVKGDADIGNNNVLRAIYGENKIRLGNNCRVTRWICSETSIEVSPGCHLGRSTACTGKVQLGTGCRFQSLFGGPVITAKSVGDNPTTDRTVSEILETNYPVKTEAGRKPAWRIIKKAVSINCHFDTENREKRIEHERATGKSCCGTEPGHGACNEEFWEVSRSQVITRPNTTLRTNFAARKELVIEENCLIYGAVKAYKNIYIKKNTVIHGDIFCEKDIHIGDNCTLLGNVFSQASIYIGKGVRISQPETIKSVIAKRKIEVGKHAVIYGYILAEGEGLVT
jgi:predicted acyltransferase (DUF342 family)